MMSCEECYEEWDTISVLAAEMRDVIEGEPSVEIVRLAYPGVRKRILDMMEMIDKKMLEIRKCDDG